MQIFVIIFFAAMAGAGTDPLDRFELLLKKYPPPNPVLEKCVTPRIRENPDAKKYRTKLSNQLAEVPPAPNFCARYHVMAEPITGGGALFLADCQTGKIKTLRRKFPWLNTLFRATSCLLVNNAPAPGMSQDELAQSALEPPMVFLWKQRRLFHLPDSDLSHAASIVPPGTANQR